MEGPGERTVLVVDDEPAIVEVLAELLAWEGYAVRTAANGADALARALAERPDVILLDLMMPVMDGARTVAALRGDPALRDVPVVIMSAAPLPPEAALPRTAALKKPFEVTELRRVLARVLGPAGA